MCHDCSLCHPGPVGNAAATEFDTKPFLFYMYSQQKVGSLPDPQQDSDMDGVTDLAELTGDGMGGGYGDPNDPLVGLGDFECPTGPLPEYGCARISRGVATDHWALLAALLPGLLLLRRRH
jgi:hypothetical protein